MVHAPVCEGHHNARERGTDDAIRKTCVHCEVDINEEDLNIVGEFNIDNAQELLNSTDTLKHKVVYIAGFLSRKHQPAFETDEVLSTEFLDELNRGGLSMPTLSTLHFVYCGMKLHELLPEARRNCGKCFQRLLYFIDSPIAKNNKACATLKNTLYKGFVLNNSDQEKSLGLSKGKVGCRKKLITKQVM